MATTWKEKFENAQSRLKRGREKATAVAGQALQSVEIAGTGLALGYARGRLADPQSGDWKVAGVDPEILVAAAGHGFGFLGFFGKYGEHVHNVADGALCAYAVMKGMDLGVEKRNQTQGLLTAGTAGTPQMSAGSPQFGTVFDQFAHAQHA